MNPPFATPAFLMRYPQVPSVLDYRPAIDDTATRLVFERTVGTQKAVNLYMLELPIPGAAPQPFRPRLPESTRRPWCSRPKARRVGRPSTSRRNRPGNDPSSRHWRCER